MTTLLTLRLLLSTDFGNADSSTRRLPCIQAGDIAAPRPEMLISLSSRRTSPWFLIERKTIERFTSMGCRCRPQFRDQPQDIGEQSSRDGDLCHLKRDIAAMADDLQSGWSQPHSARAPVAIH